MVIGGVNVYFDNNHLTVTYAKMLAPYLYRELSRERRPAVGGPGTPAEDPADNMADMSAPAGWYPDPQPPAPGSPPQQR